MMKDELLETIALVKRTGQLSELWFDETTPDPILNMSLFILERHLTGQLVTPTSLAQAAGVPYTTAKRRFERMLQLGLLEMRPRTRSGRSFSVHPSQKLISRAMSFLTGVRAAIGQTSLPKQARRRATAPTDDNTILPPSIARKALGFGTGLNILVPDDPAYAIGKRLQRELTYLMGGNIRFFGASIDELRDRVLENAGRRVSDYDVAAVDLPLIAEFAERGVLLPLDDVATDSTINREDFYSAAWRGAVADDKQYAIPILINPEILFYRTDLLHDAGLIPPETTSELLEVARSLHAPEQGRYGVSWTAARGGAAGQSFIQFLADFGQPILHLERTIGGYRTSDIGRHSPMPAIDTPRGHAAANFMLELLQYAPPEVLELSWGDQVTLLREGRVAMAYEWASRAAQLTSPAPVGEIGYLPHPVGAFADDRRARQRVAPVGGFAFGIPANIDMARVQTAWSAIEWLASPEVIKLLVQHGGHFTPRYSVSADPEVRQVSPMIAAVDRMARAGQVRLWPRPPVAGFSSLVTVLGEEIHAMLRGDRSVADALARAQERAEAVL